MNDQHYTTEALIDYLHGELEPDADAAVHAHLVACRACMDEYELQSRLGELLRASARADEREFPSAVKAEVWERVRTAKPGWASVLRGLVRPVVAVPAAAALALALALGLPVLHSSTTPVTVAASYYLDEHAAESVQTPFSDRVPALRVFTAPERGTTESSPTIDAVDAATLDDTPAR